MISKAATPEEYIQELPPERKGAIEKLRQTILSNLPKGFEDGMGYGMLSFHVSKSLYPAGYHCDPKLPLPFISVASQKNFVALYHMGIYAEPKLLEWFVQEYPKHCKTKLDMGKSCIRFKKVDQIPFDLIAELTKKMTAEEWIEVYEKNYRK